VRVCRTDREAGFTLIETMAAIALFALVIGSAGWLIKPRNGVAQLSVETQRLVDRLRQARVAAIGQQANRDVFIDVGRRTVWSDGNHRLLQLKQDIRLYVTTPMAAQRSGTVAGIRFFPNGGSSGAVVRLEGTGSANEVRINWLTGRVSYRRAGR